MFNAIFGQKSHSTLDAGDMAALQALASVAADQRAAANAGQTCGWFDSSWELNQGLEVTELPESALADIFKFAI